MSNRFDASLMQHSTRNTLSPSSGLPSPYIHDPMLSVLVESKLWLMTALVGERVLRQPLHAGRGLATHRCSARLMTMLPSLLTRYAALPSENGRLRFGSKWQVHEGRVPAPPAVSGRHREEQERCNAPPVPRLRHARPRSLERRGLRSMRRPAEVWLFVVVSSRFPPLLVFATAVVLCSFAPPLVYSTGFVFRNVRMLYKEQGAAKVRVVAHPLPGPTVKSLITPRSRRYQ